MIVGWKLRWLINSWIIIVGLCTSYNISSVVTSNLCLFRSFYKMVRGCRCFTECEYVGVSASACTCTLVWEGARLPWDTHSRCRQLKPLWCGSCFWSAVCVQQLATHSMHLWTWMWLHASPFWTVVSTDTNTQCCFWWCVNLSNSILIYYHLYTKSQ